MRAYFIGIGTFVTGAALQLLVVHLNSGMPALDLCAPYRQYIPITSETKLAFLGDILRHPWGVSSIGDVLMITGLLIMILSAVHYLRKKT